MTTRRGRECSALKLNKLREKPWYAYAVAICIGVVLYVILSNWSVFWKSVGKFIGYFSPVILGCVLAYIINPLARFYSNRVFRRMGERSRRALSNGLAFVTVLLFIVLALLVLLPQLFESAATFGENLDGYMAALNGVLEKWGVTNNAIVDLQSVISSSESIVNTVSSYLLENIRSIISTSADAGKRIFNWIIALILSVYLLADKDRLKAGVRRLMQASMNPARYEGAAELIRRSDMILNRYIVFNILDSLIVGVVNAVFMLVAGLPYIGLVSFVVAITNLIPTFGPVIGAVIGGFVLVLVKPWYALAFLIFTVILQTIDGYILKPRLFGNSLGVSGLWILVGVIVGGKMFGVVGILLAIPGVAILDFIYRDYLLVWLERRRKLRRETEERSE